MGILSQQLSAQIEEMKQRHEAIGRRNQASIERMKALLQEVEDVRNADA